MASDDLALLRALVDAGVDFIVIGGVAGQLLGSPVVTFDLDICYARDDAEPRPTGPRADRHRGTPPGAPADLPFRLDARTLRNGDSFTFDTTHGRLDILGHAVRDAWLRRSRSGGGLGTTSNGHQVRVASLDDLIRMKRAAGRTKDLLALEELGALRDELDRGRRWRS